jgi:hypothetical protein
MSLDDAFKKSNWYAPIAIFKKKDLARLQGILLHTSAGI